MASVTVNDTFTFTTPGLPTKQFVSGVIVTDTDPYFLPLIATGKTSFISVAAPTPIQGANQIIRTGPDGKLSKSLIPDLSQKYRVKTFERKLKSSTVNPDVTAFAVASAALAQATLFVQMASGTTVNQTNYALCDWGQAQSSPPLAFNGYIYPSGLWAFQQDKALRFWTDSRYVSLTQFYGIDSGIRVWVDDQPAATNNQLIGGTAGTICVNVTFSTNKPRLIEVRSTQWCNGISIEPTAQIWAPTPLDGPRVLCIGDSYVQGFGATGGYGAFQRLGNYLNLANVAIDGQAGSGYLANGSYYTSGTDGAGSYTNAARHTSHINWNPDIVIVSGVLNDFNTPYTVSQVQTAMLNKFTLLRAALPAAKLIAVESVMTPLFKTAQSGVIPAQVAALHSSMEGGLFAGLDVKVLTNTAGWFTGTGSTADLKADGNSDRYIGSDKAHPNDDGYEYAVRRLYSGLAPIIAA